MKIDILAFGAHPDDVELSCSGLLLIEALQGKKIGIIDLTEGELGSRGDAATRKSESADASKILGVQFRENLGLEDGFFINDKSSQLKIIHIIRKYQPNLILCNAPHDRHPDHGKGAKMVADAAFLSGLVKIETFEGSNKQAPWKPCYIFNYIQDTYIEPDFIVDITPVFETKLSSIKAYTTQFFNPQVEGPETYISKPEFLEHLIGTNKLMGKKIGTTYGEGYLSEKKLGLQSLTNLVKVKT
jgi:bacillithiol biosynthesis deacetylase BshB1